MNRPCDERAIAVTGSVAPEGARFLLSTPQIEVALFELRFSPLSREITVEDALAIRASLRAAGAEFESVQPAASHELAVAVTPAGVQSSTVAQANGWQISDARHQTVMTVLPASVAVQTSRYERWSVTLRPLLDALLTSVGDVLQPQLRTRVGLRYVNRFADARADAAGYWTERIDSTLLGPLSDRRLAARVTGSQQQLDLIEGPGRGQTIRHGCFQDAASRGAFSYLLDIDAYDTTTEQFVAEDALNLAEELNRAAAQTFRGSLADAYAAELGLVEVDGPEATTDTSADSATDGDGGDA